MANIPTPTYTTPHTFDAIWRAASTMSKADKKRLARKLLEEESETLSHDFPKLPKDWSPQPIVYEMVSNRLPTEVNINEEKQRMWEELSK